MAFWFIADVLLIWGLGKLLLQEGRSVRFVCAVMLMAMIGLTVADVVS